ncbi:non-ribosomal peptide synthetase [Chitinophaga sp. LS1]|uniref:non-ribosomal peptide synthetase n=1 Tax=Chitinophaga sp. LS1 TaxID=3051176 RepID=UPI002AABBB0F|nr:non-ribosomal peptide synthetase [Chitinophaga sp. LS1]WPV63819.1 amino acid adenylation domain-containing protein [Chitinophaga sp. LS1]
MTTALTYRLSPQQQSLLLSSPSGFNYSKLSFSVAGHYTAQHIQDTFISLLNRYDIFRLILKESDEGEWLQSMSGETKVLFTQRQSPEDNGQSFLLYISMQEISGGTMILLEANPLAADVVSLMVLQEQLLHMLEEDHQEEEGIGYLQYAEWQYQLLDSDDATEALTFWNRQHLHGELILRNETPSGKQAGQPEVCTTSLPLRLCKQLYDKANHIGITPETIFLGAYLEVLQLLTDSELFSVGLECYGREFDELSSTVGLLSKVLPFTIKKDQPDLFQYVDHNLQNIKTFQLYTTSDKIYDYQFGYIHTENIIETVFQWIQGEKLKCQITEQEKSVEISYWYNPDYFREEDIRLMLSLYVSVLNEHAGLAGRTALFRQTFAEQVAAGREVASAPFLHVVDAFRAVAARVPGNMAVRSLSGDLTYDELNRYSDLAAASLVHRYDVKAGDFVGVMMNENQWLPVALLAVMKAGAAYVPLDSSNPPARIQHILADVAVKCIISDIQETSHLSVTALSGLCQDHGLPLTVCDFDGTETAYMIYTSGTTGRPKGVMITGANLLNYTNWLQQTFHITQTDQSILQASYAYDLGYTSLWGCLTAGAAIHIVPAAHRQQAEWMVSYIREQEITFLKLTPSVFYLLLQAENIKELAGSALRLVFSGGEKIDTASLTRFSRIKKDISFVNHYGPTETTIGTLFHLITPETLVSFGNKPVVGKPVSGNEVYIVNDEGRFCVPGEKGEILIAGAGVAKGYYNRDDLNQEKFRNIVLNGKTIRVYHTGDNGYLMGNGTVFLDGRKDGQVKIHGHRVELEEIKRALQQQGITDIFLKLIPSRSFGEELVCYYLSPTEIDSQLWRKKLSETLPDYMLPVFFVRINTLPVTANGKVDYTAFPDPYLVINKVAGSNAVMNETETLIATTWSEILGLTIVASSDFFESGGDSIKAIQIIARLNKKGLKCQLSDIFEYTSVQALAAFLKPEKRRYALLPMQEAMYFHYKAFPGSAANNIIRHFEITGNIQPHHLQRAVQEAVLHFDILRLRFAEDENFRLYCTIADDHAPVLNIVDLRQFSEEQVSHTKTAWINEGFDLAAGPLLRATLFLQEGKSQLLWSYHHIIMDGWCFQIIVQQMMECYEALCKGVTPVWKKYTSFTRFLEWKGVVNNTASLSFWKEYLEDYTTVAALPATNGSVTSTVYDRAEYTLTVPEVLTGKIALFCRQHKITPSTFMQVAWGILLGKYNNTADVVFGVTVSGRPADMEGMEDLLGLFINTLPIRIHWNEYTSIGELFSRIRNYLSSIQAHQHLSLAEIQSCSALKKDLLDHVMVFENYPLGTVDESEITITSKEGFGQVGYPLAVVIYPGENFMISFMYNRHRYTDTLIEKTAANLLHLMEAIIAPDNLPVAKLDILSAGERAALIKAGQSAGAFNPAINLLTAIANISRIHARNTALEDAKEIFSYSEMMQKAARLSGWLIKTHQIRKGDRVLICLPPSADLVIAILAVLQAGAAYVPVDVEYPPERKMYIASDSEVKAIISSAGFIEDLTEQLFPLILMEDLPEHNNDDAVFPDIYGDDIAYIIYTSGSTGKPKGCQVMHRNLSHLFLQQKACFAFSAADKWIMAHSPAFDFSVWEIFGALVNGGSLYIPGREQVRDGTTFLDLIINKGVTVLNQTPASFYQLTEIMISTTATLENTALRLVIFGGDILDFVKLRSWLSIKGHDKVALYNLYGITETTVHVTWHQVTDQEILHAGGESCIGKPLPGVTVYIVNKQMQLCAAGVPGEILVAGDGVSAGYYKKEALTSQKFIPDPITGIGKIYKSGDMGRWMPDGNIEFLGRIDNQVKIRGYRIEPGEIVCRLQEHAAIREACVIAVNVMGMPALVAYIVFKDQEVPASELRLFLAATLPAHFIPPYYMPVEKIPLTGNGKVDREKLPSPVNIMYDSVNIPPQDDLESYLVELWESELGIQVSTADNFFETGGHSLKAFRIISAVQKKYDILLPVIQLYHDPVLKDFADTIRRYISGTESKVESGYVILKEGNPDKTVFFFPPAVGYAIGFKGLATCLDDFRVIGINFIEGDTIAEMAAIVQLLQPEGELVFCGFSAGGSLSYHVTTALEAAGRIVKALVFLDSRRFIQASPIDEQTIRQIADEYLADPRAMVLNSSVATKEMMRRHIENSARFIHQLCDSGYINADIYYISSVENRHNTERQQAWQEITAGRVIVYNGYGSHAAMLDQDNLQQNLAVYREVFNNIFF